MNTVDDVRNLILSAARLGREQDDPMVMLKAAETWVKVVGADALTKQGKPADVLRLVWPGEDAS